jgi:hypothetical protein
VTSYISFQIYLIGSLFGACELLLALCRRNPEHAGVMMILVLCCGIGLSCSLPGFLREFAGMYEIAWSG